jgi:UDP-3-O-[3-hydroxymyristoyl] glucosamine N-acyltransferase
MGTPELRDVGIREDVVFGERVIVHRPVNLYGCVIGDDVLIGPFVEIQSNVRIGNRTKIQSHAFICEGSRSGTTVSSHTESCSSTTRSRGEDRRTATVASGRRRR